MELESRWACLAPVLLLLTADLSGADDIGVLRVGLYNNPPKIYLDDSGQPSGFWPRLVSELARRGDWTPRYVPCEWAECLQMLESGDIDVMPDVAQTAARSERFMFGNFPVLHSWSEIYHKPSMPMTGIADIAGTRIAVTAESIQQRYLQSELDRRGIEAELVLTSSFEDSFALVAQDEADATIANRFVGGYSAQSFGLISYGMVLNPGGLYFAFAPDTPRAIVDEFDMQIARLMERPDSEYYASLQELLAPRNSGRLAIPTWIWWLLAAAAATLMLSTAVILTLRRMVAQRTADLEQSRSEYRALASKLMSERERERKAIARDIHDELGQDLTAMKLDLHSLLSAMPAHADTDAVRQRLDGHIDRAVVSIRRIASDLRPPLLDELGLTTAIEALAEDFTQRSGIECRVETASSDELRLDDDGATQAFRIVQESLTNVARHSNASSVSIEIKRNGKDRVLSVTDNGTGIGRDQQAGRAGLGVLGMRERAASRGWHLDIGNAQGGGTRVRLRVPVGQAARFDG